MKYRYQYTDDNSRQSLINVNKDKVLIEEQFLVNGNFLIFDDGMSYSEQITDLKSQNAQMLLALVKGGLI